MCAFYLLLLLKRLFGVQRRLPGWAGKSMIAICPLLVTSFKAALKLSLLTLVIFWFCSDHYKISK